MSGSSSLGIYAAVRDAHGEGPVAQAHALGASPSAASSLSRGGLRRRRLAPGRRDRRLPASRRFDAPLDGSGPGTTPPPPPAPFAKLDDATASRLVIAAYVLVLNRTPTGAGFRRGSDALGAGVRGPGTSSRSSPSSPRASSRPSCAGCPKASSPSGLERPRHRLKTALRCTWAHSATRLLGDPALGVGRRSRGRVPRDNPRACPRRRRSGPRAPRGGVARPFRSPAAERPRSRPELLDAIGLVGAWDDRDRVQAAGLADRVSELDARPADRPRDALDDERRDLRRREREELAARIAGPRGCGRMGPRPSSRAPSHPEDTLGPWQRRRTGFVSPSSAPAARRFDGEAPRGRVTSAAAPARRARGVRRAARPEHGGAPRRRPDPRGPRGAPRGPKGPKDSRL